MLHNFNMDQDITVIESEYDLQHFLENGYNVINYTESFDNSFPGGMFKNLIFSKYYLLKTSPSRACVQILTVPGGSSRPTMPIIPATNCLRERRLLRC